MCHHLLINNNDDSDTVFPNVGRRDCMHAVFMLFGRILVQLFQDMHLRNKTKDRVTLNQRLANIGMDGIMRDDKGALFRVLTTLFKEADLTAMDRVSLFFFLPHVLGHKASLLPVDLRQPVLRAVAVAQQIMLAVRGLRSYSKRELEIIFDDGWVNLKTSITHTSKTSVIHGFKTSITYTLKNVCNALFRKRL